MHLTTALTATAILTPLALGRAPMTEDQQLYRTVDLHQKAWFGLTSDIHGDLAIVGSPNDWDTSSGNRGGKAHILSRSGGAWSMAHELVASDHNDDDVYGRAVSVFDGDSWDVAVVGDYTDEDAGYGTKAGAIYIYENDGSGWTSKGKFLSSEANPHEYFGYDVACAESVVIASALNADNADGLTTGAVYVFTRDEDGAWSELEKIEPHDGTSGHDFGISVAMDESGEAFIVGCHDGVMTEGSAYVYRGDTSGFVLDQKLTDAEGCTGAYMGTSVDIDGDIAVVGASEDWCSDSSTMPHGAAYVFEYDQADASWSQVDRLLPDELDVNLTFGESVAVSGDRIAVDTDRDDTMGTDAGMAYVFTLKDADWVKTATFVGLDSEEDDALGRWLALDQDTLIAGSGFSDAAGKNKAGAVYFFDASVETCDGDVVADGTVDINDILSMFDAWSSGCDTPALCASDVNGDGAVDISDLLMLLSVWGDCF
jgi:hypothetical protein